MSDQPRDTPRDPEEDSSLLGDLVGEPTAREPGGASPPPPRPGNESTEFDRHRQAGEAETDRDAEPIP